MKLLLKILSYLALIAIITPPVMYLSGQLSKSVMSNIMLAATILWFATVPFWMGRKGDA